MENVRDYITLAFVNVFGFDILIGYLYLFLVFTLSLFYLDFDWKIEYKIVSVLFFAFVLTVGISELLLNKEVVLLWLTNLAK